MWLCDLYCKALWVVGETRKALYNITIYILYTASIPLAPQIMAAGLSWAQLQREPAPWPERGLTDTFKLARHFALQLIWTHNPLHVYMLSWWIQYNVHFFVALIRSWKQSCHGHISHKISYSLRCYSSCFVSVSFQVDTLKYYFFIDFKICIKG